MNEITNAIPERLKRDRYWKGLLFLFANNHKLNRYFTAEYVDLKGETVAVAKLKKLAAPWSQSEKFMLNLALHVYNDRNKVDLGDMDLLDDNNSMLAIQAIQFRYGRHLEG